ncbi:hypothetical protein FRB90_005987 [Tulasnella sp. 427]|nr:hypothetical protein FRB90_005987 [Tulasnella sp. 427]
MALVNRAWSEWALDLKWRTSWVPLKSLVSLLGSMEKVRLGKVPLFTLDPIEAEASAKFLRRSRAVTRVTFHNGFGLEPSSVDRVQDLIHQHGSIFSNRLTHARILLEIDTVDTARLVLAPSLRDIDIKFGWPRPPHETIISFTKSIFSTAAENLRSVATLVEWTKQEEVDVERVESFVVPPIWEALTSIPNLRHVYFQGCPLNNSAPVPGKRLLRGHTLPPMALETLGILGIGRKIPATTALAIAATPMPNLLRFETPETCLGTPEATLILTHLRTNSPRLEILTLCLEQDLDSTVLWNCLSFVDLRQLLLTCKGANRVTEADWSRIMMISPALPNLRELTLKQSSRNSWEVPFTVSSFIGFANRASNLESLTLPLNAMKFGSTPFLGQPRQLRNLQRLFLVVYIPESACGRFAQLVSSMCPNLQDLNVVGISWNGQVMKGLTQMVWDRIRNQVSTGQRRRLGQAF